MTNTGVGVGVFAGAAEGALWSRQVSKVLKRRGESFDHLKYVKWAPIEDTIGRIWGGH